MSMQRLMNVVTVVFYVLVGIKTCESLKIKVYNGTRLIKTYEDSSAAVHSKSYGIPYYDDVAGNLVYPNPRNACSSVDTVPSSSHWIAFVPDYDDCIGTNADNAYNAGFLMMITYSSKGSKIDESYSDLPQAIVDQAFSNYLIENVVFSGNDTLDDDIKVIVSEDYMAFYERLLIIFGLVLLSAIILAIAVFFCTCLCRCGMEKWRRRGLTVWRIRQLPRRRYRKGRESTETCSICLEDFREKEYLRVLPCDHVFHTSCVDEWLKNWNRVCPLCKSSISRTGHVREREPLLTDLESGDESSSYGSIRMSGSNQSYVESPEPVLVSSSNERTNEQNDRRGSTNSV